MAQEYGSLDTFKEGVEKTAHGGPHRRLERGHVAVQAQKKALIHPRKRI